MSREYCRAGAAPGAGNSFLLRGRNRLLAAFQGRSWSVVPAGLLPTIYPGLSTRSVVLAVPAGCFRSPELAFLRSHEMFGRIDVNRIMFTNNFSGQGIDLNDAVDRIAKKLYSQSGILISRVDFQRISANAEFTAAKIDIIPLVLHIHQPPEEFSQNGRLIPFQSKG